jgi:hypothetical protein
VREIRTLRAMWRGLETTHGSDTEALSTETESKQSRPNLRSIGASPRPYRAAQAPTGTCFLELADSSRPVRVRIPPSPPVLLIPSYVAGLSFRYSRSTALLPDLVRADVGLFKQVKSGSIFRL